MCDSQHIKPMIETEFKHVIRKTSQSRQALSLGLAWLDQPELRSEAMAAIDRLFRRPSSVSIEDVTIRCAWARILELPYTAPRLTIVQSPTVRKRFGILAQAWTQWAIGQDPSSLLKLSPRSPLEFGGALQWMSLDPWEQAIQALSRQDSLEARRLFRRSIQLGTQCQTESNPVVQWAYVASFFNDR